MTATFRVKNFEHFQHYKHRCPPWFRLYNSTLDHYHFGRLPDASKAHLFAIWLLASRYDNVIPYDPEWIARKINATQKVDLEILEKADFIVVHQQRSKPLARRKRDASKVLSQSRVEESRVETEKKDATGADAPAFERELFSRGKQVLGQSAGGLISKLLKSKGGDVALARAAIETASTKENPREYLSAAIRKGGTNGASAYVPRLTPDARDSAIAAQLAERKRLDEFYGGKQ